MQYEERDYLIRWLKRFFEFLSKLLNNRIIYKESIKKEVNNAYNTFFKNNRDFFLSMNDDELAQYSLTLLKEQIRPLALLLYHDAKIQQEKKVKDNLFQKSKLLLLISQKVTGTLDFDDYTLMSEIDGELSN